MFLAGIWSENSLFTLFNIVFMFGMHVEFEVKILYAPFK